MLKRLFLCGLGLLAGVIVLGLIGSVAVAQQPPQPDGPPLNVADGGQQSLSNPNGQFKTGALVIPGSPGAGAPATFRSDALGGEFVAQWLHIVVNNQSHPFWGARAVSLDRQSPLRTIGLVAGDVITRLDDKQIWEGMVKQQNVWQMPQLNSHYGRTEVRYIKQGTQIVKLGNVVIDNVSTGNSPGTQPLLP